MSVESVESAGGTSAGRPRLDRPSEGRPSAGRPSEGRPRLGRPSASKPKASAALVSIVLLGALFVGGMLLGQSDRTSKPMLINGDVVGISNGESLTAYQQRVAPTVDSAVDEAFALVTFSSIQQPDAAAQLLEEAAIQRVSAMIISPGPAVPLPEPAAGMNRAEVFQRSMEQIARASDLQPGDLPGISGVVVWDRGDRLRALAENPNVFAVEVLPSDAAWGRFGIRPVTPDQLS